MIYFIYLLLIFAALFFELTLAGLLALKGIKPDVMIIVIGFIGIRDGRRLATAYGFLGGIVFDVFSAGLLGVNALAKTIAAFTSRSIPVFQNHPALYVVVQIGFIDLIYNLVLFLVSRGTVLRAEPYLLAGSFVYTLFFTFVVLLLLPSHYLKQLSTEKSYY
ncbi:rod shape-determining protein MreD [candidate division KSB1 bacterium]|nr:rod shape-determining protein MreD [candidate division KSB1 bacterium]